jgi:hypothetical protein
VFIVIGVGDNLVRIVAHVPGESSRSLNKHAGQVVARALRLGVTDCHRGSRRAKRQDKVLDTLRDGRMIRANTT